MFIPLYDEVYYSISSTGEVMKTRWREDNGDLFRKMCNNVFKTLEDAEKRASIIWEKGL